MKKSAFAIIAATALGLASAASLQAQTPGTGTSGAGGTGTTGAGATGTPGSPGTGTTGSSRLGGTSGGLGAHSSMQQQGLKGEVIKVESDSVTIRVQKDPTSTPGATTTTPGTTGSEQLKSAQDLKQGDKVEVMKAERIGTSGAGGPGTGTGNPSAGGTGTGTSGAAGTGTTGSGSTPR